MTATVLAPRGVALNPNPDISSPLHVTEGGGSNAWAIAGDRARSDVGKHTSTGKPLLANDPHLEITAPNVWYQIHLSCPSASVDVSGASLPGSPSVLIGHNRHIGWGITVG